MNDTELDRLLQESSPRVVSPAGLAQHQARILKEARSRARRRGRTTAAALGLTVVLVGGGSAAMAGAGMETPWGWIADNLFTIPGETPDGACFAGYRVVYGERVGSKTTTSGSQIVQEAQEFLASLDLESIDISEAEKLERKHYFVDNSDGTRTRINVSEDQLRQNALGTVVAEMFWDHLEAEGFPEDQRHGVSFMMATDGCDE